MKRIASISVDLDEIRCYAAIHGIALPAGPVQHTVYDRCLPRLEALFARESIRCTFFAIGADLDRTSNRARIRALHDGGHEIANHSFGHRYDLSRCSQEEVRADVERGTAAIGDACGSLPVGFRAPGYVIDDAMFRALERAGVEYDSSVFPCPSYYLAKVGALGWMALRGRRSTSIVDTPSVLRCPRQPYRVGRPYWRTGYGILELPIGVTRWGLPFIGTSLVLAGHRGARSLTRQMLGLPWIHLELHGFDVADVTMDGLGALAPHRPDLRRTAAQKLAVLSTAIRAIRAAGYVIVPLKEAAAGLSERPNR